MFRLSPGLGSLQHLFLLQSWELIAHHDTIVIALSGNYLVNVLALNVKLKHLL